MANTLNAPSAGRLSPEEVRRLCGDEPDWKLEAILETGADIAELEAALAWVAGEDEVLGKDRQPLAGRAAEIYEILLSDVGPDDER